MSSTAMPASSSSPDDLDELLRAPLPAAIVSRRVCSSTATSALPSRAEHAAARPSEVRRSCDDDLDALAADLAP